MLKNINEDSVQMPLEHWQAWDIKHFSVAVFDHPHINEMFPNIQSELLTSVDFNRKGFQCLHILCKMKWEIMLSTWKCFCTLPTQKRTRDWCWWNSKVSHWFQCALGTSLYFKLLQLLLCYRKKRWALPAHYHLKTLYTEYI